MPASLRNTTSASGLIKVGGIATLILAASTLAACSPDREQPIERPALPPQATAPSLVEPYSVELSNTETHEGLLHGRVTLEDGTVYEGRMRFGGDEEALWSNYFNGFKANNVWVDSTFMAQLPMQSDSLVIFGVRVARWKRDIELGRPFMARFGDIERIDPRGHDLQVTLKSGSMFHLDRYAADDLADGLRVWDETHGVVDLDEWSIRSIEFASTERSGAASLLPLHGTVRTRQGEFTGLIQWNREQTLGADMLRGVAVDSTQSVRFDMIQSIVRRQHNAGRVTLIDGRELPLSGTSVQTIGGKQEIPPASRGIYVDDPRYGRVLISWDALERVDFTHGGTGPAYSDYAPGHSLEGTVITRAGRSVSGRLVYDLDESETTETLDAPAQGVDYTIPFALIASITPPSADQRGATKTKITLRSGEELQLDRAGDLGEGHGGMLIFAAGANRPEYVPWAEVKQVIFEPKR